MKILWQIGAELIQCSQNGLKIKNWMAQNFPKISQGAGFVHV